MSDEQDPSAGLSRTTGGGVSGRIAPRGVRPFTVAPTTAGFFNVIRDPLIPVACWRMDDVRFEFASSFILPDAADEFTMLSVLMQAHAGSPLSLFGHADPVGDDEFNKRLSGRRAIAVFAVLMRDAAKWEQLFNNQEDHWGVRSLQLMLTRLGFNPGRTDGVMDDPTRNALQAFRPGGGNDAGTRQALYLAYMDSICKDINGARFQLTAANFLAQGADPDGRGDIQGCSEFNPVLMFSQTENTQFANAADKTQRNAENAPNRRVTGLLFRAGTRLDLGNWPCPAATAPSAPCRTRFFADHALRRSFQALRRTNEADHNTFACRFFDILNDNSSCEHASTLVTMRIILQRFPGTAGTDAERAIANVPFTVRVIGGAQRTDRTAADGTISITMPQNATAVVEVLGSQYVIQALDALENVANLDGVKRRLEILGHDVGTIDTTMDQPTERGVLNFQADNGIRVDGVITPATRTAIQNAVHTLGGD